MPPDALRTASLVFYGKAVRRLPTFPLASSETYEFEVIEMFKGSGARVFVKSSTDPASCGIGFETGRDYLVYAHSDEQGQRMGTSICTRTRPADWSYEMPLAEELELLRAVKGAEAEPNRIPTEPGWTPPPVREVHRRLESPSASVSVGVRQGRKLVE